MDVTEHGHYIAGKQVPAAAEARFEVLDPATNRPIARVASGGKEDVAAGNTVVLKPATLTPLTALQLGALAGAAGFPAGVVNIVTGPGRTVGEALANHREVDSVTFTGSTDTGKQLLRIVSDRVIPTTLELGGKNPQIVLPDAKMDRAVKGALWGAFQNAGQMCWAGSKLLVHQDIAAAFLGKLKDQTEKLRLGPGLKEDVQMGPLVSRDHAASVAKAIDEGVSRGAKVLAGGRRADAGELKDGHFP